VTPNVTVLDNTGSIGSTRDFRTHRGRIGQLSGDASLGGVSFWLGLVGFVNQSPQLAE
jgi:hypothetical protein